MSAQLVHRQSVSVPQALLYIPEESLYYGHVNDPKSKTQRKTPSLAVHHTHVVSSALNPNPKAANPVIPGRLDRAGR